MIYLIQSSSSQKHDELIKQFSDPDISTDQKLMLLTANGAIRRAREKAVHERKTLNVLFREWAAQYAGNRKPLADYQSLMKRLSYASAGRKFSREELNER